MNEKLEIVWQIMGQTNVLLILIFTPKKNKNRSLLNGFDIDYQILILSSGVLYNLSPFFTSNAL